MTFPSGGFSHWLVFFLIWEAFKPWIIGILLLTALAIFIIVILRKTRHSAGRAATRMPSPSPADKLLPMVIFYGGPAFYRYEVQFLQEEIDKQIRRETERKKQFSSVAIAWLRPDGKVHVELETAGEPKQLIFQGELGELAPEEIPSATPGSAEYYRVLRVGPKTSVLLT